MRTKTHMCMSVRGALRMTNRQLMGVLKDDTGRTLSGAEAREALLDELEKGHKVIPCCAQEECPDFDYSGGGCPGHVVEQGAEQDAEVRP